MKILKYILVILNLLPLSAQVSESEGMHSKDKCKYASYPNYIVNNSTVYYEDCVLHKQLSADAASFNVLSLGLAHDKNNIFYDGIKLSIKTDHPQSISLSRYWLNGNTVYYEKDKIHTIDRTTFKIIDEGYYKDKHNVYHDGVVLRSADVKTFTYNSDVNLAFDKDYVYHYGEKIFENGYLRPITGTIFKDDTTFYEYRNRLFIPVVDFNIETASWLLNSNYGIINNSLYYKQKKIALENINLKKIKVITENIIIYNKQVYYKGLLVNGFKAKTLVPIGDFGYSSFVKKRNKFYELDTVYDKKINIEEATFEKIDKSFVTSLLHEKTNQNLTYLKGNIINEYKRILVDKKTLEDIGFKDFDTIEVVSVLQIEEYAHHKIIKNSQGFWRLEGENILTYIGKTYKF